MKHIFSKPQFFLLITLTQLIEFIAKSWVHSTQVNTIIQELELKIQAKLGDIVQQDVDAIVNAANSSLAGGAGVDGAIHKAAGEYELQQACQELGGCDQGDAKATLGFNLKAKWIIHTVGPIYKDGNHNEAKILGSCYTRSIAVADELGARSIAFPAISTGVYRFPKEYAARIAVSSLFSTDPKNIDLVYLVAFDEETFKFYQYFLLSHQEDEIKKEY